MTPVFSDCGTPYKEAHELKELVGKLKYELSESMEKIAILAGGEKLRRNMERDINVVQSQLDSKEQVGPSTLNPKP